MSALVSTETNETLDSFQVLNTWANDVIQHVKGQSDERLIELARDAQYLEKAAYRVRGACGLELKTRIKARLLEKGRSEETQIGPQMSSLAAQIGVASKTLLDDVKIAETFPEVIAGDTELAREYYRIACSLDDPQAGIEMARAKLADGEPYDTWVFREDVRAMNAGEKADEIEPRIRISRLLQTDTSAKLRKYLMQSGQPLGEVVDAMAADFLKGV